MPSQFAQLSNKAIYTRLVFARHGQTENNTEGKIADYSDEGLDEKGIEQMQKTAKIILQDYFPDVVFSSTLPRAIQSAQIITKGTHIPFFTSDDLLEFNFGAIAGLTLLQVREKFPDLFESYVAWVDAENQQTLQHPIIPDGEDKAAINTRIKKFTDMILAEYRGKNIVVISHGAFIKCCLHYYAGGDMHRSNPYWVDNASISVVDFYKNTTMIRLVNDIHHLGISLKFGHPTIL